MSVLEQLLELTERTAIEAADPLSVKAFPWPGGQDHHVSTRILFCKTLEHGQTSMNSAISLVKILLPGWFCSADLTPSGDNGKHSVTLKSPDGKGNFNASVFSEAPTVQLAILIAIYLAFGNEREPCNVIPKHPGKSAASALSAH